MKKNYDLSALMRYAWSIYRNKANKCETFGEALRRAWKAFDVAEPNHSKIDEAIHKLNISERVRTWFGWTEEGRKVKHDEKTILQVTVDYPERGIGKTRILSFFAESQTDLAENVQ